MTTAGLLILVGVFLLGFVGAFALAWNSRSSVINYENRVMALEAIYQHNMKIINALTVDDDLDAVQTRLIDYDEAVVEHDGFFYRSKSYLSYLHPAFHEILGGFTLEQNSDG